MDVPRKFWAYPNGSLSNFTGAMVFPYIDQSWDEAEQDTANVMELLE